MCLLVIPPLCYISVRLTTEPGISLIILPLMRILQRNMKRTTDTLLFISHTTKVLLFKFRCNIFIGVRIIKEMPGSVASGTSYISVLLTVLSAKCLIFCVRLSSRSSTRSLIRVTMAQGGKCQFTIFLY